MRKNALTPERALPSKGDSKFFTDREEYIKAFHAAAGAPPSAAPRVLVFYGVGGVGKTQLSRELRRHAEQLALPYASFDLASANDRTRPDREVLLQFRSDLQSKYKVQFPRFELCWSFLVSRSGGPPPALAPVHRGLGSVFAFLRERKGITWSGVSEMAQLLADKYPEAEEIIRWAGGTEEVLALREMSDEALQAELPRRFAEDMRDDKAGLASNPARKYRGVLFLDTYEALWYGLEGGRSMQARQVDLWVRHLAELCVDPRVNLLLVISGREQLTWAEYDQDWAPVLEHHLLGGLTSDDTQRHLAKCGIGEPPEKAEATPLQKAIITCCSDRRVADELPRCLPLYVALCADIVVNNRMNGFPDPEPETFSRIPNETIADVLTDRFLKSLHSAAMELWVEELSLASRFNKELALAVYSGKEEEVYAHVAANAAWERLIGFSFVENDDEGFFTMHKIMQTVLADRVQRTRPERFIERHLWYAAHYEKAAPAVVNCRTRAEADLHVERFQHLVLGEQYDDACVVLNTLQVSVLHKWGLYELGLQSRGFLADRASSVNVVKNPSEQSLDRLTDRNRAFHLYHLIIPLTRHGSPLEAIRCAERAMTLFRNLGDSDAAQGDEEEMIKRCHNQIGIAYTNLGQHDLALAAYERAFAVAQARDQSAGYTYLGNVCEIFCYLGRLDLAVNKLHEAAVLLESKERKAIAGKRSFIAGLLGRVAVMAGDYDLAIRALDPSIQNARAENHVRKLSIRYQVKATAQLLQRDTNGALDSVNESLQAAEAVGAPVQRLLNWWLKGRIEHARGNIANARGAYEEGLAVVRTWKNAAPDDEERAAADLLSYRLSLFWGMTVLETDPVFARQSIEGALARSEKLLALTPRHLDAAYTRALAKTALGHDDALRAYKQALRISSAPGVLDMAIGALDLLNGGKSTPQFALLMQHRAAWQGNA